MKGWPKRGILKVTTHPTIFFVLPINEINSLSSDMGVVIENDYFDIFDLLKDLETMRHNLYNKQKQNNQDSQTHLVESAEGDNAILLVEWVQEESSEAEDFILVESRKKIR